MRPQLIDESTSPHPRNKTTKLSVPLLHKDFNSRGTRLFSSPIHLSHLHLPLLLLRRRARATDLIERPEDRSKPVRLRDCFNQVVRRAGVPRAPRTVPAGRCVRAVTRKKRKQPVPRFSGNAETRWKSFGRSISAGFAAANA